MTRKKNDKLDSTKSNSFALFGDDSLVSMGNNSVNNTDKKVQETKTSGKTEQIGSQSVDEKPKSVESGVVQGRYQAKRGFRALKNNKDDIVTESGSSDVKGQSNKETDGAGNGSGTKQQRINKADNRSDNKTRRNKRKVQKSEGGSGVHEGIDSSCETITDYTKYKLREFEVTNKVQNYSITGKPRKTKDDFLVEVIIDGFRYRVSPWSIKGNQYIQGLDSNFLVKKYKVGKR
jgi:hypothetical protein